MNFNKETNASSTVSLANVPPIKSITIMPSVSRLITFTHHARGKPLWHLGEHDTLTYCVSGCCVLYINGQYHLFRPGQLAFCPKGTPRGRTPISNDLLLHEVQIDGNIDDENVVPRLRISKDNYVVTVPQKYKQLVELNFEQVLGLNPTADGDLLRAGATTTLLGLYINACLQSEKNECTFAPVLRYMHDHLDSVVTLPMLAALVHMEPSYFIRQFKKKFGESPIAYYNSLRMAAAIEILSTTKLSLEAVGAKIGISDPYHFSKFFKAHCTVSPNQYRESIKDVKTQMEELAEQTKE